jgi:hypothetical protein
VDPDIYPTAITTWHRVLTHGVAVEAVPIYSQQKKQAKPKPERLEQVRKRRRAKRSRQATESKRVAPRGFLPEYYLERWPVGSIFRASMMGASRMTQYRVVKALVERGYCRKIVRKHWVYLERLK